MNTERCMVSIEKCSKCGYWEPIPFHDNGGVCMAPKGSSKPRFVIPQIAGREGEKVATKK